MNAIHLIQGAFEDLHREVRADIADIEPDVLWWRPTAGANHAGFLAWHIVRDEDAVVSYLARKPEIWVAEGWHARLGMDPREQGTGVDPGRLDTLRYNPAEFLAYAEQVWTATGPAIARLAESDLDRQAWPGSDWTVAQQLIEGCVGHSWLHLGEIRYIRGLRGWRFRE